MQKTERKIRRERKHRRLAWVLAAFVLLAGSVTAAILLTRNTETELPHREAHGGTIAGHEPEELLSVTITRRGQAPWTLVRDGEGQIRLEGADGWTADSLLTDMIQDAVINLVYEDILTEDPGEYTGRLSDFGLADPAFIVEARYTGGETVVFRLGDRIGVEEGWYYLTVDGDDRLYAVSAALKEDLDVEPEMLHPVAQPEIYPALLDRITVAGTDGQMLAEWRLRGSITDQDAGTNWFISAPFVYPADEEMIQNLKTSAGNLRMGIYLEPATEDNLKNRGLAEPAYTLELHMAAGSTGTVTASGVYDVTEREESTVVLGISESSNEMINYVRFGDEIFSVSHLTLTALIDTDPLDTAARYIAVTPLNSLDSLTIEENGTITEYVLERTGESDPGTAEETVICRKNGEEVSYTAFAAAYERLLTVTIGGKLPQGAEWKEAHTKYTFRSISGGTHTVAFSDWDGMHDAVTMDGETVFYLIRKGAAFQSE